MATRAPKEILKDSKIIVLIDDMEEEVADALETAVKLSRSSALKHAPQGKRALSAAESTTDRAYVAYEREYVLCEKGKSTDIAKLKKLISSLLDATDDLIEINGRIEVLEDADLDAKLFLFLTLLGQVVGYNAQMRDLMRDLESVHKKLEGAIKGIRDAKTKAMFGAALGATVVCITPLGATVAVLATIGAVVAEQALDAVLDGNVDGDVKKSWDKVSKIGDAADTIANFPKAYGPVMVLINGAVDIADCFGTIREKDAFVAEAKAVKAKIDKLAPAYAKMYREMDKKGKEVMTKLTKAARDVNSFKPGTSKTHNLPNLLK
ncbi:MAG: hypothetical protein ACK4GW_03840 [Pseudorhodobacter sp.]